MNSHSRFSLHFDHNWFYQFFKGIWISICSHIHVECRQILFCNHIMLSIYTCLFKSHFLNIVLYIQLFNQLYTCTGPCIPMYYTCISWYSTYWFAHFPILDYLVHVFLCLFSQCLLCQTHNCVVHVWIF